jgi:hypothetical protein
MSFYKYAERFIYTAGNYKEFRGYLFWNGKPVTVTDPATIGALIRRPDFLHLPKEDHEEKAETQTQVLEPKTRGILRIRRRGEGRAT